MNDWEKSLNELLAKLVDDELTGTEQSELNDLLANHPEAMEFYHQYLEIHSSSTTTLIGARPMFAVSNFSQVVAAILRRPNVHVSIIFRTRLLFAYGDGVRRLEDARQIHAGKATCLVCSEEFVPVAAEGIHHKEINKTVHQITLIDLAPIRRTV